MTETRRGFLRYQLPALFWALAIFVSSSIPSSAIPEIGLLRLDKLWHALLYFLFTLLVYRSFRHQIRWPALARHALGWAILAAVLYAATDELHQLFVPGRAADWQDFVADAAGSVFFGACILVWRRRAVSAERRPV